MIKVLTVRRTKFLSLVDGRLVEHIHPLYLWSDPRIHMVYRLL